MSTGWRGSEEAGAGGAGEALPAGMPGAVSGAGVPEVPSPVGPGAELGTAQPLASQLSPVGPEASGALIDAPGALTLLDTTLRDGEQRAGVALTLEDKLRLTRRLDEMGIHFIEVGYPASNDRDRELFERLADDPPRTAQVVALGATRRKGVAAEDDAALVALADCPAPVASLVGKASAEQVIKVLETTLDENLAMVADSVAYLVSRGKRVFFDAEHYFDGYFGDPGYALAVLEAAAAAGAELLVLCDTNGGALPHQVYEACLATRLALADWGAGGAAAGAAAGGIAVENTAGSSMATDVAAQAESAGVLIPILGIHCHDDSGVAVANSLEAVRAGCLHVQGTVNGYGERVGNADILAILANLQLKMGYKIVSDEQLARLTELSLYTAAVMNITPDAYQPFSGVNAFAHKGGLHSASVLRHKPSYEHVDPAAVGNFSRIVISELAGRTALASKAAELGVSLPDSDAELSRLLAEVKARETDGYSYEAAEASLSLYLADLTGQGAKLFELESFRVITEKRADGRASSEATVKLAVAGERVVVTGEGVGPVNALDSALRLAITRFYPEVERFELTDYKVRVIDESTGTSAVTRVLIETSDRESSWGTIGVSENIIEASWDALVDSLVYGLLKAGRQG